MLTCSSCRRVSVASVPRSTPALPWLERGRRGRRPFEGACDSAHSVEGVLLVHSVGKGMGTTRAVVPEVRTYVRDNHTFTTSRPHPTTTGTPPSMHMYVYFTDTRTHACTHTHVPAQCSLSQHRGPPLHRHRLQNAPLPGLLNVQDHW